MIIEAEATATIGIQDGFIAMMDIQDEAIETTIAQHQATQVGITVAKDAIPTAIITTVTASAG